MSIGVCINTKAGRVPLYKTPAVDLQENIPRNIYPLSNASDQTSRNSPVMSVLAVHLSPEHGFSKTSQPSINLLKGLGVEGDCHLGKTTQHLWRLKNYASEPNLRQVHLIPSELLQEADFHGEDGVRIQPGQMGENVTTTGIDLLALSNGTKLHFVDSKYTQTAFESRYPHFFYKYSFLFFKYMASSVLLEVIAIMMGHNVSWSRIALASCGALNGSLFHDILGFWPNLLFTSILLLSVGDSDLNSVMMSIEACVSLVLLGYWWYTKDYFGEQAVVTVTGLRHPCKKVENFRPGLLEKCMVRGGEKNSTLKRKAGVMAVVTRAGTVKPGMTIIVETTWRFKELPVLR